MDSGRYMGPYSILEVGGIWTPRGGGLDVPRGVRAHLSMPTPPPQAAAVGPARGRDPGAGEGAPGAAPAHLQLLRPQTPPRVPSGVTWDPQLPPLSDLGPPCRFVNKVLGPPLAPGPFILGGGGGTGNYTSHRPLRLRDVTRKRPHAEMAPGSSRHLPCAP